MGYYSYNSKPVKRKYVIGLCLGWFLIATLVDHFIIRQTAPWYTRLIALEQAKLSFDPFYRNFTQLSFTTFVLVPFIFALVIIIFLGIKKKMNKDDLVKSISTLIWSLGIILVAVIIGHIIYRLVSGIDWSLVKVVTNFCEGYKIEGQIYLFNLHIVDIKSGIGAIVGLAIGFYLYYQKGVLKILVEKAGLDLS